MTTAAKIVEFPGSGRGSFFAIDRRAWALACKIDINAMVAYLVLARGTGHDQRTTSWSVNAIETYTGIGRPRAGKAIEGLVRTGLVRVMRKGTKPRYYIVPAHEVPGCEGFPPPALDTVEQKIFDRLSEGRTLLPKKSDIWSEYRSPRTVAAGLVGKGCARDLGNGYYEAVIYDAEAAAKPDWIWLPNAIIDGAAGETAPVELVRQTQNVPTLRLLVELYHVQALASDGGIHWRSIRRQFTRHKVGERGPFIIYGFEPDGYKAWRDKPFVNSHMTGQMEVIAGTNRQHDRGWSIFWNAWNQLERLDLVEFVGHLIEADNDTADIIHPYAIGNGEAAEQRIARAAHKAGAAMLTAGQRDWAASKRLCLAPVRVHIENVQMVGIVRLRYRPRTSATAAWFARMAEWDEWAVRYDEMAAEARGDAVSPRMQHQGTSR